jgi:hypothetical protein
MRSPHKYDCADPCQDDERLSIIPALLWVAVIVIAGIVGWYS